MKLKDLIESNNTGLDAIKRAPIVDYDTGVRCLRIGDISNNRPFNEWGYTEVEDNNYNKFQLKTGDIIVARTGATIGVNKYIDKDYKSVYNNGLIRIRVKQENNPKYVYYLLQSTNYKKFIKTISMGTSTQPNMQMNDLLNLEVPDFDKPKQDKIVKILEKIDDKIELNNEINNNLQELSNLNYGEFIKSIKDNEECNYKELPELGKILMGQSPKGESYNYEKNGLPLINGAADYEDGYLKAQKYTSNPIKICKKDDLLFCIRATIGLLVICDKEYCLGRGVAGITNIDPVYKEYAYHIIDSSVEDFKRMATGSVIVGISRDNIENILVKIPTKAEIEKYHSIEKSIFDKIENIRIENKKLKDLRDTLLPKLMNGEIDLDNIEI